MPDFVYRLMERHQKLDALLRHAQMRKIPNAFEILRIKTLKLENGKRLNTLLGWHGEQAIC
ncbi:MAG: DUF465 domain-containing protein [Rhodocyclaceae bacterium]|nr:MAG: DUF465 domain-containing protein [Rhodocyclaceae bacterium]